MVLKYYLYFIHNVACTQIRSSNEFLQSEWSEPLVIPLFPDKYPNCGKCENVTMLS